MKFPSLVTKPIALSLIPLAVALSSCGGGGGGGSDFSDIAHSSSSVSDWQPNVFKSSDVYADKCAVPRTGVSPTTGVAYPDKKGTVTDEKNWIRSISHETYLWYKEIVDIDPNNSDTPEEYFAKLKTNALTSNGTPKDKFHFTENTDEKEARYTSGQVYGYGFGLYAASWYAPRNIVVSYVQPGSPAANAGIKRGTKLLKVDGVDSVNDNTKSGVEKLNEGLFPSVIGSVHTFEIMEPGATTAKSVTLQSASVTESPVLVTKTLDTSSGKVGYILFNTHIQTAEAQMADAISKLKADGVTDLVLDLRYNGGGLLFVASEVGYMVAGAKSEGKVFEQLINNDLLPDEEPDNFRSVGIVGVTKNVQLPTLDLSRIYILSSSNTCSASESIINGLRGIDVEVILVGAQTCGKPYGFYGLENCGVSYSTINFSGVNAKKFGDYSDGFIPSSTDNGKDKIKGCNVSDDFNHDLGDPAEKMLATALNYRATGSCGALASPVPNALIAIPEVHEGFPVQPRQIQEKIIFR